jgi:hypothetical protein
MTGTPNHAAETRRVPKHDGAPLAPQSGILTERLEWRFKWRRLYFLLVRANQSTRSALLWLTALFAVVGLTALTGLTSWKQSLVEAALIFVVYATLFAHRPFRQVLGRAPRRLQVSAAMIAGLWGWSQLHEVAIATYPFISWRMYGERLSERDFSAYRLLGERCDGEHVVVPPTSGATGRRPILSIAVRRSYERSQTPGRDQTQELQRLDKLLLAILVRWNQRHASAPLCALSLQQASIDVREYARPAESRFTTVRRYDTP